MKKIIFGLMLMNSVNAFASLDDEYCAAMRSVKELGYRNYNQLIRKAMSQTNSVDTRLDPLIIKARKIAELNLDIDSICP